jgi:hypothetical protein
LPAHVPVDEIARWLAQLIEQDGHLKHDMAAIRASERYGRECRYDEPGKRRYRHGKLKSYWPDKYRFHPDILRALKKLTGKSVIWEKDCRGWHKRKSPGLVSADR